MMENYQEKYKKELHQQEINSNIHTLKGFFWIFVTILLLWLFNQGTGERNLYCGFQNLYHGSRGVGGDGNSCFIHL